MDDGGKFTRLFVLTLISVPIVVVHSLGHVCNVYVFSVSNLSILSCLFPKVFLDNG